MRTLLAIISLVIITCTACLAATSALPPLTIPNGLGVNIHFAGRDTAQIGKIAAAGFKFIRMDFIWNSMEPKKGVYDFKLWDDLSDSLTAKGIRPIYILDYGNPIYKNASPPFDDDSRAAFAAFAKAAAAHFKGKGVVWEIYNEPNGAWFWKNPNAEDYVKLAKAISKGIREGDPDSIIIGPATCGIPKGYIERAFQLGLLDCIDAVSVHAYGAWRPEEAIHHYNWLHKTIGKYAPKGRSIPIISGEWGYPSYGGSGGVTVEQQADYLARMFIVNTMCGCRISIWYDWRDDGTNANEKEHNFGILYNDLKEKPAYSAMKILYTELNGYSFVRRIRLDSLGDYAVLFRKNDDYRIAAWTINQPHAVSIPVDTQSTAIVSQFGEKKQVEIKNGAFDLTLTGSMQYIEPSSASKRWASDISWKTSSKAE